MGLAAAGASPEAIKISEACPRASAKKTSVQEQPAPAATGHITPTLAQRLPVPPDSCKKAKASEVAQQQMEVDKTRVRLPAGQGAARPLGVERLPHP
jgi:hypothetical protein